MVEENPMMPPQMPEDNITPSGPVMITDIQAEQEQETEQRLKNVEMGYQLCKSKLAMLSDEKMKGEIMRDFFANFTTIKDEDLDKYTRENLRDLFGRIDNLIQIHPEYKIKDIVNAVVENGPQKADLLEVSDMLHLYDPKFTSRHFAEFRQTLEAANPEKRQQMIDELKKILESAQG